MLTINFSREFEDIIESGKKTQTIRRSCKVPEGGYFALMSGFVQLGIANDVTITQITVDHNSIIYDDKIINLSSEEGKKFVIDDGFYSVRAFLEFLESRYTLPFNGVLIKWSLRK